MRLWSRPKSKQLDLLEGESETPHTGAPASLEHDRVVPPTTATPHAGNAISRLALMVPINLVDEDPNNPRTEFPEAELNELTDDIRHRGILQPIVVHPADARGRHRIHFGAKRWRAAQRAGLTEVPVVVREEPGDPYAQVAENQKRHGLTPLDLARFIRGRVDAAESHATIAKRLGMDLTSVAHHLTLLELPPEIEAAMQSGRCTSPRTLHELNKLHREAPEQVRTLLDGDGDITRVALQAARSETRAVPTEPQPIRDRRASAPSTNALRTKAELVCTHLERAIDELANAEPPAYKADLDGLKKRLASLAGRLP